MAAAALALVLAAGTGLAFHRMSVDRDLLHQPLVDLYTQRVDPNSLLQELYAADLVLAFRNARSVHPGLSARNNQAGDGIEATRTAAAALPSRRRP